MLDLGVSHPVPPYLCTRNTLKPFIEWYFFLVQMCKGATSSAQRTCGKEETGDLHTHKPNPDWSWLVNCLHSMYIVNVSCTIHLYYVRVNYVCILYTINYTVALVSLQLGNQAKPYCFNFNKINKKHTCYYKHLSSWDKQQYIIRFRVWGGFSLYFCYCSS